MWASHVISQIKKKVRPNESDSSKIQKMLLPVFFPRVYKASFWSNFCCFLMDDDGSRVIESLDSLWFFSNVFSSTSPKPLQELVFEEPSKPTSQMLQNQKSQESPRCTRCGELSAETEPEMWKPIDDMEVVAEMESPSWTEKEERRKMSRRRRRRRRSKRSMKQRREILGELDSLCFDGNEVCETWMFEGNCGDFFKQSSFGGGDQNKYKILPPFDDNTAMKEHLKSWAYAVACTVR